MPKPRLRELMPDVRKLKLGRRPSEPDDRDLKMATYLADVPEPPASVDYSHAVKRWGELANDRVGCCAISGIGHQVQSWTANASGQEATITDAEVLQRYEKLSGYVPGDESTDTGLDERSVLKDWAKNPFVGHDLAAFASLSIPHSTAISANLHFRQALWLLGGVYLGLDLPLSAQDQIADRQPWDVVSGPEAEAGSWGGHAVYACSFSEAGVTVVTWGRLQLCTWAFISAYTEEAWGLVSTSWLKAGKSPQGFARNQLEADLKAVRA